MSKKKEKKDAEKEIESKEETNLDQDSIEEDAEDNAGVEDEKSVAELEDRIHELEDTLLRKVAEFENYKRRTENDQMNLIKYSAESFILKILPVFDDLGRSVNHLDDSNDQSFKDGLKLVYDKFAKILDEQGVKKIEAKGNEFDVDYHEALMQQPSNEFPANTVLEEVESGYIYKDKVIRHSKVIVSQELPDLVNEDNDEPENENGE